MERNADCPSTDQLAAFSIGKLACDDLEAIARHLEKCEPCTSSLDHLRAADDPLAIELGRPAPDEPFDDAACRHLVERIQAAGPNWSSDESCLLRGELEAPAEPENARLGHYHLLEEIGHGSMGVVYKARHLPLDKLVALKVLPAGSALDPLVVARFRREMRAIGQLDHPHIVRAIDAGDEDGILYLAMELVEGLDLSRLSKHLGPLPLADAAELARQAAVALQYAHEHFLVHRDVKPSNLMLAATGMVKLLDLGLALLRSDEKLTTSHQIMGTADYMAPEQASNAHSVDARADIYSLGCTLYMLLAGQPPFGEQKTPLAKLKAHQQSAVPPINRSRPGLPHAVQHVLDRMLAKQPGERFQTCEVVAALQPFTAGHDLIALLSGCTPTRPDPAWPE